MAIGDVAMEAERRRVAVCTAARAMFSTLMLPLIDTVTIRKPRHVVFKFATFFFLGEKYKVSHPHLHASDEKYCMVYKSPINSYFSATLIFCVIKQHSSISRSPCI